LGDPKAKSMKLSGGRLPEFLVLLAKRLEGKWLDIATYGLIAFALLYVGGHLVVALMRR